MYVRKSQARGDRQVLSIPAQIKEMTAYAEKLGIQIVAVFQEERTAKEPGRPVFNEMMDRIEKDEAEGIISWKLDRLSRNPIDDARLSWALEKEKIQRIQTIERSYRPEDNVLFMRMEQGMANQYVKDLSKNVKRGMRNAAENGWLPISLLPLGYIRNKDKESSIKIIPDPRKFSIVKELWKLYGTGAFSMLDIEKIAQNLGLTNQRGKPIHRSVFYRMFRTSFYAGYFHWKDQNRQKSRIEGKHKPMISEAEFQIVQDILENRKTKKKPKVHSFIYKEILSCGECGGSITAQRKRRTTCSNCKSRFSSLHIDQCPNCKTKVSEMKNPIVLDKTYYHCTKKTYSKCSQKAMSEKQIEETIEAELSKIEINEDVYNWAKSQVKKTIEFSDDSNILLDSLKKKKLLIDKKHKKLLDLLVAGEIAKVQYDQLHEEYKSSVEDIQKEIIMRESRRELWEKEANNYLDFAFNSVQRFKNANGFKKLEIISTFLSNQKILDKTLIFQTKRPLRAILSVQSIKSIENGLEPVINHI